MTRGDSSVEEQPNFNSEDGASIPPPRSIQLREKTVDEKVSWIINQLLLEEYREKTRESKLDYIIGLIEDIDRRIKKIEYEIS